MTSRDTKTHEPIHDALAPVVIAVTTDDDRYARSREIAMVLARHAAARLVLYDWEAATVLGDPMPTAWSADGPDHREAIELDEDALEAAGHDAIADQVAEARERGVEATGWLPSTPGVEALGEFAARHKATAVVLPEGLEAKGRLERLREGAIDPGAAIRSRSRARVVIVPRPLGGG